MGDSWGWAGDVERFLSTPLEAWAASLEAHHRRFRGSGASASQRAAWRDEHAVLTEALSVCAAVDGDARRWSLAFEYELPLEGGRRPDAVVLAGSTVVVLEFKAGGSVRQSDVDQVAAYARDLADYHAATAGRRVVPVLVLTAAKGHAEVRDDVVVTSPEGLAEYVQRSSDAGSIDLPAWLEAPYEPLPTLVAAARRLFRSEPLPHVRRALAEGIPETVEVLARLCREAAAGDDRALAFVTGVPGAGKTLVGLRLVHETATGARGTFLSGNGPLVQVLQDALGSRAFVRDLHAFVRTYGLGRKAPAEHVVVFDEAQRAWDRAHMQRKHGVSASEPDLLVRAGERVAGWAAIVGLVGEGQEIHSGEEAGLAQWDEAAAAPNASAAWTVHCPPKLAGAFAPRHRVVVHERLDLTASLRSRRAEDLHRWVALLLDGDLAAAARRAVAIHAEGFPMYVTRDLDEARSYARWRYAGEPEKRFGLLASSHAKVLPAVGVRNDYATTKRMDVARWYNAAPTDPGSCCALAQPVTEFGCQGLELDLPVVCWGEDHRWTGTEWLLTPIRRRAAQRDPQRLLRNAYRVLLTRGRDGLVVFVPDERFLDATEHAVLAAGVRPLTEPVVLPERRAPGGVAS